MRNHTSGSKQELVLQTISCKEGQNSCKCGVLARLSQRSIVFYPRGPCPVSHCAFVSLMSHIDVEGRGGRPQRRHPLHDTDAKWHRAIEKQAGSVDASSWAITPHPAPRGRPTPATLLHVPTASREKFSPPPTLFLSADLFSKYRWVRGRCCFNCERICFTPRAAPIAPRGVRTF